MRGEAAGREATADARLHGVPSVALLPRQGHAMAVSARVQACSDDVEPWAGKGTVGTHVVEVSAHPAGLFSLPLARHPSLDRAPKHQPGFLVRRQPCSRCVRISFKFDQH